MGKRALFVKEWYQLRRNLPVLIVVLILLPGVAALGTSTYQQTIPEDVPVGVTPADESVTEEELLPVQGGLALYATPERYDSTAAATQALEREDVYLVLEVPAELTTPDASANVTMYSDQRFVPFQEPANYTESVLSSELDDEFPADVEVDHVRIGEQYTLSEFLVPTVLVVILLLYALVYVPFELYREQEVYDRVSLLSSIESAVVAKIAFHALLLVVPVAVFQLVSLQFGYRITHFGLAPMATLALSFVYLVAIGAAVMFFCRLRRVGLYVNMGLTGFALVFSGLVYPIGFFSRFEMVVANLLPSYHSMVVVRSTMLKGASLGAFGGRLAVLVALAVASLLVVRWGINHYRKTR